VVSPEPRSDQAATSRAASSAASRRITPSNSHLIGLEERSRSLRGRYPRRAVKSPSEVRDGSQTGRDSSPTRLRA
jgi:hypothetical protein